MNIYNMIKTALSPLNIPCEPINYSGSATTYITYFCYNSQGETFAEIDKEMAKGFYVQVDIWSTESPLDLKIQVESVMVAAGFCNPKSQDLYEKETRTFHIPCRFTFIDMHS